MRNDPVYLSEEASLGVLSVDGNFESIITENIVKENKIVHIEGCKCL